MDQTQKKPEIFTALTKAMKSDETNSRDLTGLSIQDMARLITLSKKIYLHTSLNPLSGNSLY